MTNYPWQGAGQDLYESLLRQDHPGLMIIPSSQPSYSASFTQMASYDEDTAGFTPASIIYEPDNIEFDEDLSDDISRAVVNNSAPYIPEEGGDPFIPNSAPIIPNVFCKPQIKVAAEACAMMRHSGKSTIIFKENFNKMWGLPEDFDVEAYSPVIDPERTKPWQRWNKTKNYETWCGKELQGMIHVTCGSFTSSTANDEYAIDWDMVRNQLRLVGTNVLMNEPNMLQRIKSKGERVAIKYVISHKSFPKAYVPSFTYKKLTSRNTGFTSNVDISCLMRDRPKRLYHKAKFLSDVIDLVPSQIMQEMKMEQPKNIGLFDITKYLGDFDSGDLGGGMIKKTVKVTKDELNKREFSFQNTMRSSIKSWISQTVKKEKAHHRISAYYELGQLKDAATTLMTILPTGAIEFPIKLAKESQVKQKVIARELVKTAFGSRDSYPNFDTNEFRGMIEIAFRHGIYSFLDVYISSYNLSMSSRELLTIFDFIPHNQYDQMQYINMNNIKQFGFNTIAQFYISRYEQRMEAIQKLPLTLWKDSYKDILLKMQLRILFIPQLGYIRSNHEIYSRLLGSMAKFVGKRKRLTREYNALISSPITVSIEQYMQKVDNALGTKYLEGYKESESKAKQMMNDIDRFSWFDQYEFPDNTRYRRIAINRSRNYEKMAHYHDQKVELYNVMKKEYNVEYIKEEKRCEWPGVGKKFKLKYINQNYIHYPITTNTSAPAPIINTTDVIKPVPVLEQIKPEKAAETDEKDDDFDMFEGMDEEFEVEKRMNFDDWFAHSGISGNARDAEDYMITNYNTNRNVFDEPHEPEYFNDILQPHAKELFEYSRELLRKDYKEREEQETNDDLQ